jgi:phosphohistidine swiveling domain-containing protein
VVQAAARRLASRGDLPDPALVDFLTAAEVRAALGGAPIQPAAARRRRKRHEAESRLPAPREVNLDDPAASPARGAEADGVLRGIGVSAGVAIGRARVAGEGPVTLEPGEVLVVPVLDAALAPLLANAAGAVVEIGGILSHGSVVAREMGVPCVVDVHEATRRIQSGETVIVDGSTGLVRRALPDASSPRDVGPALGPALVDATTEGLHPLEPHPLARESVYFNMYDPGRGLAVVFAMAVKPQGAGEALLTLGLPDGRVAFGLERGAAALDARGFRVGGFRLDWHPLRLSMNAPISLHGASEFPPRPVPLLFTPRTSRLSGTLHFEPHTAAVDFCETLPAETRDWVRPLGAHHVEQSGRWHGDLTLDARALRFDGRGSRDHSWGIRDWEAADHWRLFMAPIHDRLAIHALIVSAAGRLVSGGFVSRDGETEGISRVECAAVRDGAGLLKSFELELQTASGLRRLTGRVERTISIPVQPERRLWRHLAGRPYRLVLHENFTRYEMDGAVGHGIAEFTERPL